MHSDSVRRPRNGENAIGPHAQAPQEQLSPGVKSTPCPLFHPMPKTVKDLPSLPPRFLGSTIGGRGWQGLTAWSLGKDEDYRNVGGLAEAGVGTCGPGRPRCQWYRTPGETGDLSGGQSHTGRPVLSR